MDLKGEAVRRALVTGADGFIGSHLTELLVDQGLTVRALAQYNSFNNWGWLEDVDCKEAIEVVSGDIRDPHFCDRLMKDVDVVFNLAALIAIPYSYVAPDSYVDTNIRGTVNLCQAALRHGVRRFIQTSTSEVYGTALYVPMDEKHPVQPQSPYAASKIASDAMAMSFHNAFDLPVTLARPFNTYGPRQSARAVIPAMIVQIASGVKTIKVGDLTPTRDFNFVLDTCRGLLALAECEAANGETVNIGSNFEISIRDTIEMIKTVMGSDVEFVIDPDRIRPGKSEVLRLWCDNTKIKQLTGFTPRHSFSQGLEETVSWMSRPENLARYKAGIYNV